MGSIILLALGASVFPTLLACVAVMIARPEPLAAPLSTPAR
jgi:hypothetical protein